jgi:hypothetical protein
MSTWNIIHLLHFFRSSQHPRIYYFYFCFSAYLQGQVSICASRPLHFSPVSFQWLFTSIAFLPIGIFTFHSFNGSAILHMQIACVCIVDPHVSVLYNLCLLTLSLVCLFLSRNCFQIHPLFPFCYHLGFHLFLKIFIIIFLLYWGLWWLSRKFLHYIIVEFTPSIILL